MHEHVRSQKEHAAQSPNIIIEISVSHSTPLSRQENIAKQVSLAENDGKN
jgi:hypothetical protein